MAAFFGVVGLVRAIEAMQAAQPAAFIEPAQQAQGANPGINTAPVLGQVPNAGWESFFLVSIVSSNNTINWFMTTYPDDITVQGEGVYKANNSLLQIDPPSISNGNNRELYKLSFVDSGFTMKQLAASNIIGAKVSVYQGFVNTTGALVAGTPDGQPFLDPAFRIYAFGGVIDSRTYGTSVADRTSIFTILCTSPMAGLSATKAYTASRNAVRNLDPTDTCYDDILKNTKSLSLLWGKA